MKLTVDIDARTADDFVVEYLSDWRHYLKKENSALKKLEEMKPYQEADFKSNKKYIKALDTIIEAFTWPQK